LTPSGRDGVRGSSETAARPEPALRSCEAKLLSCIRSHWAVEFGTREVRLIIEYQNGVPVLIRITANRVTEEKLR
jgi:hypothetical protein